MVGNTDRALLFADAAGGTFTGNRVADHGDISVQVGGSAGGVIRENVCPGGVVGSGIRVVSPASPEISANQCSLTQSG